MEYDELRSLQPQVFFDWFFRISHIPRGSRNERQAIIFCEQFAKERGLKYETDAKGNVFMEVPATEGYENEPPILMQAHLDIVCIKNNHVKFDFDKDPIRLMIDGDFLRAEGTTLGADNAVGIATMLALADSTDIPHPKLELLFTVEEEVGLLGIRQFDMKKIKARRMLNMDCGYSHVLCVSSAGKIATRIQKEYPLSPILENDTVLMVTISGGAGGHSGLAANKGRACAGNEMGELLSSLDGIGMRLCSFRTDSRALLKSCTATIAVPKENFESVQHRLEQRFAEITAVFSKQESHLRLSIQTTQVEQCASETESKQIVRALQLLRTGTYRVLETDPSSVVTSGSLQPSSFENGLLQFSYLIRSSVDADMERLYRKTAALAELLNMKLEKRDQYSGWPECAHSSFHEQFQKAHIELYGVPMEIERVHGGIETGIIVGAIPDMDAVGYAPTAHGAHTTDEYLEIKEVLPFWNVLTTVLARKEKA